MLFLRITHGKTTFSHQLMGTEPWQLDYTCNSSMKDIPGKVVVDTCFTHKYCFQGIYSEKQNFLPSASIKKCIGNIVISDYLTCFTTDPFLRTFNNICKATQSQVPENCAAFPVMSMYLFIQLYILFFYSSLAYFECSIKFNFEK